MTAGADEMIKTFQGHFQEGRFVSPQISAIPEYVEVLIVVTNNPITNIQQPQRMTKNSRFLREPDPTKPSLLGCMDGLIKIPDDFDEPLEEMKEYMY